MSLKKKIIAISILIVLIAGVFVAHRVHRAYTARILIIEWNERVRTHIKCWYGVDMLFKFQMIRNGESDIWPGSTILSILDRGFTSNYGRIYTGPVFVLYEEDAANFPENVIVAWPRDGAFKEEFIAGIHRKVNLTEDEIPRNFRGALRRPVITLDMFGLSYPLTRADFVYNWENVKELWIALDYHEQRTIQFDARAADPVAFPPRTRAYVEPNAESDND